MKGPDMRLPDYKLTFTHRQLAGIEVTMGRLSIGETLYDFNDILAMPTSNRDEQSAYWDALRVFIAKHMVAWNLTDAEGAPVALGQCEDLLLLAQIRDGWLEGINDTDPLGRPGAIEASLADLQQSPAPASAPESETPGS